MKFLASIFTLLYAASYAQVQLAYYGTEFSVTNDSGVNAIGLASIYHDLDNDQTLGRFFFNAYNTIDGSSAQDMFDGPFEAHVHATPCSVNDGGPHWQLNPELDDTTETNEFHFYFNGAMGADPDPQGQLIDDFRTNVNFVIPDAEDVAAVVVHFPDGVDGDRAFCVDLVNVIDESYMFWSETLVEQVDAVPNTTALQEVPVQGHASVWSNEDNFLTLLVAMPTGFDFAVGLEYISHVHNASCDPAMNPGGGPHWMFDVMEGPALEANELWVQYTREDAMIGNSIMSGIDITPIPEGYNGDQNPFVLSVVVHDTPTMGAPRLMCLDMTVVAPEPTPQPGSAGALAFSLLAAALIGFNIKN